MLCTMKLSRSLIGRGKLSDCCDYFGIANEDAHSALSDAHATALLLGRLLEADPELARLPASSRIGRGCRGTVAHIRRIAERAMAAAWYARRGARQLTFGH